MVTKIYGTTVIPSDQITVESGNSVAVSVAFSRTAGLIGGYNASTGTATAGEVVDVATAGDAATLFGVDSELHEQAKLALNNDVRELTAVAVDETESTDNFSSTASGTLDNVPAMDPNLHDEHTITETNAGATVNIVYDSPPTAPTASNEINLNPVTGEWEADASGTYDIVYTHGDYTSGIDAMVADAPRVIALMTENVTLVNELATDLDTVAQDFTFIHGVAGAAPVPDPTNAGSYTSGYSDTIDEIRMSLVSPARAYTDVAETNDVRTMGAVAGRFASLPLGISATMKNADGFASLRAEYTPTQAGELTDEQVLPLIQFGATKIVKDMTTSTDARFERFYAVQVVDEVTELSHQVSQSFLGEQNIQGNIDSLEDSHDTFLREMRDDAVPLLNAYTLNVQSTSTGASVEIGIEVVGVIDTIKTNILVGDVVTNGGTA
ncbi:tail sheath [Haloarcula tailed virus 2]|uniref:Tail sheath n=1 Tax=Haloarcula tailed virus 2 TaxID=2877989 RepID=A0AAE9BY37_9CAUD|nr:tail sheath [Haloarcula tailed virus 2]UBF23170.1 tail sheath [Haloarcula tailed virus 2]